MSRFTSVVFCALAVHFVCAIEARAVASIGEIAAKSRGDALEDMPCCVTGVVTFASGWRANSGIVADVDDPDGAALWFAGEVNNFIVAELIGADRLAEGDIVRIEGVVSLLGFAPGIRADRITILDTRSLPPSPLRRLRDFDWGVMDNRRAAIDGVLMDVRGETDGSVRLQLGTADGMFLARVPGDAERLKACIDAEVRVRGLAMSIFNIRSEFVGVQMEVVRESDVTVISPPPVYEDVPCVPASFLLPYAPEPPDAHRRRVRGVVTYAKSGEYAYIQCGESALKVKTSAAGLKPGDEVEAVGFPWMEDGLCELTFSEVRRISSGSRPEPQRIGWAELDGYPVKGNGTFQDFNARLVRIEGRMESYAESGGISRLNVDVDGCGVEVALEGRLPFAVRDCAPLHPLISITGILTLEQEQGLPKGRIPAIAGRKLFVASADDIGLVIDEAWRRWHRWRAAKAVGSVSALAAAISLLAVLVRFVSYRRRYRRLAILTEERKRMAGDLHDTIEQSLVTAKILLDTAVSLSPDAPETMKKAIGTAQEIMMSAKSEIRETIFNLRNDELFKRRPEDVLLSLAQRLASGGVLKVRTKLRGLPDSLAASVFSDMLFIMQEAVTNAVKHGGAKNIVIVSDPVPGGFAIRVVNDGEPFDAERALGPEAGHFGLAGMRQRARRAGIKLSFETTVKDKVSVKLEVKA